MKKQSNSERRELRNELYQLVQSGDISVAEALKKSREIVGKSQEDYASLVGISKKVIVDIEKERANPTLDTLNRIFSPLGLEVGLKPKSR